MPRLFSRNTSYIGFQKTGRGALFSRTRKPIQMSLLMLGNVHRPMDFSEHQTIKYHGSCCKCQRRYLKIAIKGWFPKKCPVPFFKHFYVVIVPIRKYTTFNAFPSSSQRILESSTAIDKTFFCRVFQVFFPSLFHYIHYTPTGVSRIH